MQALSSHNVKNSGDLQRHRSRDRRQTNQRVDVTLTWSAGDVQSLQCTRVAMRGLICACYCNGSVDSAGTCCSPLATTQDVRNCLEGCVVSRDARSRKCAAMILHIAMNIVMKVYGYITRYYAQIALPRPPGLRPAFEQKKSRRPGKRFFLRKTWLGRRNGIWSLSARSNGARKSLLCLLCRVVSQIPLQRHNRLVADLLRTC